ncbi:hypothetical protein GCM10010109_45930 [Actinoplanes campanulatus]|nr:hypothetical protein GCM10010109_45930 [Actinoplanes campanulatus]
MAQAARTKNDAAISRSAGFRDAGAELPDADGAGLSVDVRLLPTGREFFESDEDVEVEVLFE